MGIDLILSVGADLLSFLIVVVLGRPIWQRRGEPAAAVLLGLLASLGVATLYNLGSNLTTALFSLWPVPATRFGQDVVRSLWAFGDAALVMATACWLHFFLVYPEPHPLLRRRPWLAAIPYVLLGLLSSFFLVESLLPLPVRQSFQDMSSMVDQLVLAGGGMALLGGFYLLVRAYIRTPAGRTRRALHDLLIGLSAVVLLTLGGYVIPELLWGVSLVDIFPLLEPLLLLILLSTFAFAILRYQVFDVHVVLSQGLGYAVATLALMGLYIALAAGLTRLLGRAISLDNPLILAFFALLVAVLFNTLRLWSQEQIDRLFYRQRYDYRRVVREFGQDLSRLHELAVLMPLILERVVSTWQTRAAALILREGEEEPYSVREIRGLPERCLEIAFSAETAVAQRLARSGASLIPRERTWWQRLPSTEQASLESLQSVLLVPLRVKGRLIGWLSLGETRSGRPYTPGDIELLGMLADQAGVALENALVYEHRRREVAALEVLNRIGLAATTLELDDLLEQIYREVSRLVDAPNMYIALYDEETQEFSFAFSAVDARRRKDEEGQRWPLGEGLTSDIVRTAEPIVTQDYVAECERRHIQPRDKPRGQPGLAWLGVPLLAGTRVLGVLVISSPREGTVYRAEHVRLLSTIASQTAVVIERARAHEREQQRVAELETLNEIAQAIGSSFRLEELLPTIYRAVQRVMDAPNFYIALVEREKAEFTYALYIERGQPAAPPLERWTLGEGLSSQIVLQRQPIRTDDYEAECRRRGIQPLGRGEKAWLGVPMIVGDEVIGVMVASSFSAETAYTEEHLRLFSTIAAQAGSAVQNARLYERTDAALDRRVQELTAIEEIARELNTTLDFRRVLDVVLERAIAATDAMAGSVALRTPDGESLLLLSLRGLAPEGDLDRPWSVQVGILGRVVRTGRPALVPDVRRDPDYVPARPSTRSELAVPILYGGQPIGVINLESDRPAAFDEESQHFLERLAEHAAIAIQNARLFQERERRISELSILNEIGRALSSALDLEQLLTTIHQQVGRLFDTTDFYIATYDPESDEWESVLSIVGGKRTPPERHKVQAGLTGHIIRNRTPLLFHNTAEVEAFERQAGICRIGPMAKSWLGVPLIAADRVVGVMGIENYERENCYSEQDLALFSTIAAQAAIAIANAGLFRGVTEVRDRLQAILDSTHDGILMLDEEGYIVLANPQLARWCGLPPEQMIGICLSSLSHRVGVEAEPLLQALAEGLERSAGGRPETFQEPLHGSFDAAMESGRSFEWLSLPVLAHGEQPLGRVVVLRDVTAARQAERLREDLVSMIVHDLRGPLTAILGALETLLQQDTGPLTDLQTTLLEVAQEGGRHMLNMVNTLLDIRQLEAGKMPLRFAPVGLAESVQEAVSQLAPLTRERHLCIIQEIPDDLPPVRADGEKIVRVLGNLVHNAIKYSYPGGLIQIRACRQGSVVQCAVVDHGMGIPLADQERIFEKFVQGRRNVAARGTGLGLAFCRLAVEAHGGHIWVESEEGQGSTFYFTLPVWEE